MGELVVIPGIDPRVDIAFKKVFGSPAWSDLTMSLIDAVLRPAPGRRLVHLDLLNPYSEQDSLSDKLTVLDIKARDERGRWFNVEMQMYLGRALARRLLYYWARLYGRQLVKGNQYRQLRPTISICFVNQTMFRHREEYHSVFRLVERDSRLCLTEHLEIHVLEIRKFRRALEMLREPLDFWLYFLQNGGQLDADALPGQLARPEIRQAMEVLKVFSQSELERDRYENRLKVQRDYHALMWERDEATRERDEALEGRDVALQANRRNLLRRIQLCQRLLGHAQTPSDQLMARSPEELQSLADELEQQLPDP